jgi:hypothetical protein
MATNKKITTKDKIADAKYNAKTPTLGANKSMAKIKAEDYVYAGLKKTGLSTTAMNNLAKKLIPVVQNNIQNDFSKTAMRAKIVEMNAKKKK